VGEPYVVSAEIRGAAGLRGQLAVYRNDDLLSTEPFTLGADETTNVRVTDRQQLPGIYTYRAVIRNDDDFADADDAGSGAVVSVSGRTSILYAAAATPALAALLREAGFDVVRAAPESIPASERDLARYDGIVLDDVVADRL